MKNKITGIVLLSVCLLVLVCSLHASEPKKPFILTTTTDLADIAKAIVGDQARVISISSGKEDPHFLTAKPSLIVQARDADVWIRVGLELEIGWEAPILRDSRNRRVQEGAPGHIDASAHVIVLDIPRERVTRDMGDVHPYGNPHYWLDPLNGRIVAKTIADSLSELFPAQKESFRNNLKEFEHMLDVRMFGETLVSRYGGAELWKMLLQSSLIDTLARDSSLHDLGGWYGMLFPYQGSSIVTYHRSWLYLTERFGLNVAIEMEPKPGVPPSSKHLARVVETAKTKHVRVILQEPFYSRKAADFVSERTGAKVIVCPNTVHGAAEVNSYLELIDNAVQSLKQTLEVA